MSRKTEYQTKQREWILGYLEKNPSRPFTAQELTESLLQNGTPVGPSTVYRQLERMEKQGLVRKYQTHGPEGACYQYLSDAEGCREHHHLKCLCCGALIHLDCEQLSEINRHIYSSHQFTVESSKTVFYGWCGHCLPSKSDT